MIDFYTAATPNGRKIAFMLEELGVPYTTHHVDLKSLEQKKPDFIAMNPNGRIPVIVDQKGPYDKPVTVFESGAILYYLAEKYNSHFGHSLTEKAHVMQWVMFQMAGQGPMFGNYYYGVHSLKPENPAYIERFEKESRRLIDVMNIQLEKTEYFAGPTFTIADIILYPWNASFIHSKPEWYENAPAVRRWLEVVGQRPAAKKAMT